MHGLGEHCHRYDRIIDFFTDQGIRVYSFDQRGHGRTHFLHSQQQKQGKQGHIHTSKDVIMDDIEMLLQRASQDGVPARIPKVLLGHSLGGLFSVYYALTRDLAGISGLISIGKEQGKCERLLLTSSFFFSSSNWRCESATSDNQSCRAPWRHSLSSNHN